MRFASAEWIEAVVREVNGHPDLARALAGLGSDLAAVVERDPVHFPHGAAAWGRQEGGRIVEWRALEDEDDVLELEPAFVVRAPLGLWKELLTGKVDPVQAALSGRVKVSTVAPTWVSASIIAAPWPATSSASKRSRSRSFIPATTVATSGFIATAAANCASRTSLDDEPRTARFA